MTARLTGIALMLGLTASPLWAQGAPAPADESASENPGGSNGGIDTSSFSQLRDPFRRPVFVDPNARPRTELEYFPVEQYRVVGVVTGPEHMRAMVVAPNGKTYYVAEKMKIGIRKGFIKKITAAGIVVREKVLNTLGKEETVETEIRLPGDSRAIN